MCRAVRSLTPPGSWPSSLVQKLRSEAVNGVPIHGTEAIADQPGGGVHRALAAGSSQASEKADPVRAARSYGDLADALKQGSFPGHAAQVRTRQARDVTDTVDRGGTLRCQKVLTGADRSVDKRGPGDGRFHDGQCVVHVGRQAVSATA
ncbi:hypothetical protein SHIRM173S_04177 [Streptomyces hirsutus]